MVMARTRMGTALLALVFPACALAGAQAGVHHDIDARIDPARHSLVADDTVTLDEPAAGTLVFLLNRGLKPSVAGQQLSAPTKTAQGPMRYRIALAPGTRSVRLHYEGEIHQALSGAAPEDISGTIAPEGVFLGEESAWYPVFEDAMPSFDLRLTLPAQWDAVAQGERLLHERSDAGTRVQWREPAPQTGIELAAGRWQEYGRAITIDGRRVALMAFLRTPDEALAARYFDAADEWLHFYSRLFGPYPWAKFALVENFLETGYGMPSYTLLGPTVIRLPFIVHTSFPHEILHDWWGNGVYVDATHGNWCEGLTAYFADHLIAERAGTGAAMRRRELQDYAAYVHQGGDFPLADFRMRHDPASQAIGYGKAMMFFHMLRGELGEDALLAGLRDFYRERRFQTSGWDDLRQALEPHAAPGVDLAALFAQWIDRSGAPRIAPGAVHVRRLDDGSYELDAEVTQAGDGGPYRLKLPLRIDLEGGATLATALDMDGARASLRVAVPARPLRLELDPGFDVFRQIDPGEVPASLGAAFGAPRVTVVLPAHAPAALRARYRELADSWRDDRGDADFRIVDDGAIAQLPGDGAVWLLGWENALLPALRAALAAAPVEFGKSELRLPSAAGAARPDSPPLRQGSHALALAARSAGGQPLLWIAADAATLPRLARKLPHYGSSGYAAFASGASADPVLSGEWPLADSPMNIAIPLEPTPDARVERE